MAGLSSILNMTPRPSGPEEPNLNTPPPPDTPPPPPDEPKGIEDADVLKELEKRGIKVASLDELRAPAPSHTPEQIAEEKQQRRTRLAETYTSVFQGKGEDFDKYNNILEASDNVSLVKQDVLASLQAQGFSEEDSIEIFNNRYFQAENGFFSDQQIALGSKLIEDHAARLKDQAKNEVSKVETYLSNTEALNQLKQEWSDKVAAYISTMPKQLQLSVVETNVKGEPTNINLPFDVDEAVFNEVQEDLQKGLSVFLDENGRSTNLDKLAQTLLWSKLGQKMAGFAFSSGRSNALKQVEAVFPDYPNISQMRSGEATGKTPQEKAGKQLFGARR